MSERASSGLAGKLLTAAALAAIFAGAAPALAVDPIVDSMRPNEGPTASAPRQAEREMRRDLERTPTLTERFGLPPVSGPLPPLLPPLRQEPVLQYQGPDALPPPPLPPPYRARRPHDRDG
jgi:hypothetical protein